MMGEAYFDQDGDLRVDWYKGRTALSLVISKKSGGTFYNWSGGEPKVVGGEFDIDVVRAIVLEHFPEEE